MSGFLKVDAFRIHTEIKLKVSDYFQELHVDVDHIRLVNEFPFRRCAWFDSVECGLPLLTRFWGFVKVSPL